MRYSTIWLGIVFYAASLRVGYPACRSRAVPARHLGGHRDICPGKICGKSAYNRNDTQANNEKTGNPISKFADHRSVVARMKRDISIDKSVTILEKLLKRISGVIKASGQNPEYEHKLFSLKRNADIRLRDLKYATETKETKMEEAKTEEATTEGNERRRNVPQTTINFIDEIEEDKTSNFSKLKRSHEKAVSKLSAADKFTAIKQFMRQKIAERDNSDIKRINSFEFDTNIKLDSTKNKQNLDKSNKKTGGIKLAIGERSLMEDMKMALPSSEGIESDNFSKRKSHSNNEIDTDEIDNMEDFDKAMKSIDSPLDRLLKERRIMERRDKLKFNENIKQQIHSKYKDRLMKDNSSNSQQYRQPYNHIKQSYTTRKSGLGYSRQGYSRQGYSRQGYSRQVTPSSYQDQWSEFMNMRTNGWNVRTKGRPIRKTYRYQQNASNARFSRGPQYNKNNYVPSTPKINNFVSQKFSKQAETELDEMLKDRFGDDSPDKIEDQYAPLTNIRPNREFKRKEQYTPNRFKPSTPQVPNFDEQWEELVRMRVTPPAKETIIKKKELLDVFKKVDPEILKTSSKPHVDGFATMPTNKIDRMPNKLIDDDKDTQINASTFSSKQIIEELNEVIANRTKKSNTDLKGQNILKNYQQTITMAYFKEIEPLNEKQNLNTEIQLSDRNIPRYNHLKSKNNHIQSFEPNVEFDQIPTVRYSGPTTTPLTGLYMQHDELTPMESTKAVFQPIKENIQSHNQPILKVGSKKKQKLKKKSIYEKLQDFKCKDDEFINSLKNKTQVIQSNANLNDMQTDYSEEYSSKSLEKLDEAFKDMKSYYTKEAKYLETSINEKEAEKTQQLFKKKDENMRKLIQQRDLENPNNQSSYSEINEHTIKTPKKRYKVGNSEDIDKIFEEKEYRPLSIAEFKAAIGRMIDKINPDCKTPKSVKFDKNHEIL